jgi:hypothetical protein
VSHREEVLIADMILRQGPVHHPATPPLPSDLGLELAVLRPHDISFYYSVLELVWRWGIIYGRGGGGCRIRGSGPWKLVAGGDSRGWQACSLVLCCLDDLCVWGKRRTGRDALARCRRTPSCKTAVWASAEGGFLFPPMTLQVVRRMSIPRAPIPNI